MILQLCPTHETISALKLTEHERGIRIFYVSVGLTHNYTATLLLTGTLLD